MASEVEWGRALEVWSVQGDAHECAVTIDSLASCCTVVPMSFFQGWFVVIIRIEKYSFKGRMRLLR
jgi:hypothetical protein